MQFLIAVFMLFSLFSSASEKIFTDITTGDVAIGEDRIALYEKDFLVDVEIPDIKHNIFLRNGTIQWVRVDKILLKPRARIAIFLEHPVDSLHIKYSQNVILFHQHKQKAYAEFYVSLFQPEDIFIYKNDKKIGKIRIHPKLDIRNRETHVIDYSCGRYKLKVDGLDNEFLSIGCRDYPIGNFPKETNMVEAYWTSADYTLLDGTPPPYLITFLHSKPVEMTVVNRWGKIKKISIKATLPKRRHRLKTAYGLGPYAFYTEEGSEIKESTVVPAFMLYMKYDLDKDNSIRLFDALLYKESLFNNAGIYYANDVAKVYDRKITITTLLGFQSMQFKFDSDSELYNQFIFPQGLEVTWIHALGKPGYLINFGMFLSPSESIKYSNLWVRWGRKYFWELNYIDWGFEDQYAKTWGLSIGFPFKQFF